jgi:hypothetical protein
VAAQRFTPARMATDYLRLYGEVLGRSGRVPVPRPRHAGVLGPPDEPLVAEPTA